MPPPQQTESPLWYYMKSHQRIGPVPLDQVRAALHRNDITPDSLVWAEGMPQWLPASNIPALTSVPLTPVATLTPQPALSPSPLNTPDLSAAPITAIDPSTAPGA